MFVEFLNIRKDKTKRLWLILLVAIIIAILLISVTIYSLLFRKENLSNNTNEKKSIFNVKMYECEYDATVVSNKNTNNYNIKEKYQKNGLDNSNNANNINENFIFITQNEFGDEIKYEIKDNTLKISSLSQINEYVLNDYVIKKTNPLSLATFLNIYNDISANIVNISQEIIKIEVTEVENTKSYKIIFNDLNKLNLDSLSYIKELSNESTKVKMLELIVSNETNKPVEYIVYDIEEKILIDINYKLFDFES